MHFQHLNSAVADDSSKNKSDFASLMPGVKPLKNDRINVYQQRRSKPVSVKSIQPNTRLDSSFSQSDFDQQSRIVDSHFDHGINRKLQRKIRQGLLGLDDRLDLHGYTQKKAVAELSRFIQYALSSNFKLVLVIHGKGNRSNENAVLKPLVHHWLAQQQPVRAWCPAQARHGGSGASDVYLRQQ